MLASLAFITETLKGRLTVGTQMTPEKDEGLVGEVEAVKGQANICKLQPVRRGTVRDLQN